MPIAGYRLMQRVSDNSGTLLAEKEVDDFRTLAEDVAFSGVANGVLKNDGKWGAAIVEPVLDRDKVAGVIVRRAGLEKTYPLRVFSDHAWDAVIAARLTTADDAPADESAREDFKFSWEMRLHALETVAPKRRLTTSLTFAPFPLTSGTLSALGIDSRGQTADVWISTPLARDLLDSAVANLDCERAHFLTGKLLVEDGRPVVVLSCGFPALVETGSSAIHFGFSPQTFAAARREVDLRGDGLAILGWAHNHPPPCKRDCLATVPACKNDNLFFSAADHAVHRASFSAPYAVGLVVGKSAGLPADDPEIRAFGWSEGVIVEKSIRTY